MSGIYIPNMEMPKSCNECPMRSGYWCYIDRCVADAMRSNRRRKECPLVEVPTHGDLWDKDKVFKVFDERMEMYRELGYKDDDISIQELGHIQADLIAKVETVIEAST